jgi:gamma-glutamyl-gamma-aminobutyrate hydrolase PuuD
MQAVMRNTRLLRIGLSPRFLHNVPPELGVGRRGVQYLVDSVAHWVMSRDALIFMIPAIASGGLIRRGNLSVADYVAELDGLVLQGGADVSPQTYGEVPLREEWQGDRVRDLYELELLSAFIAQKKPVFGICRGLQLINVAFGGTLYQDIHEQVPGTLSHNDAAIYDRNFHDISFVPDSGLARLYPQRSGARVNTIHHQAIKELGDNIMVEARAEPDRMIEAIRWKGDSYVFGVQWHPELHDPRDSAQLDGTPMLSEFLHYARVRAGLPTAEAHAEARAFAAAAVCAIFPRTLRFDPRLRGVTKSPRGAGPWGGYAAHPLTV